MRPSCGTARRLRAAAWGAAWGALRLLAGFALGVALYWAMSDWADHALLSEYVQAHPCLERRRTLPKFRVYLGVGVWREAATGYECPAVESMVWIDDPQPERFR